MQEKIIIVSIDNNKIEQFTTRLLSIDPTIHIADMFSTALSQKNVNPHYIDNDELYLDYKNNALLCTKTIAEDVSIGYTKEEYNKSDIIIMGYDLFCNIAPKVIKGVLVVWIDNPSANKDKETLMYSKEFMELMRNKPMLYFSSTDLDDYIITNMFNYISGTEEERKKILLECN